MKSIFSSIFSLLLGTAVSTAKADEPTPQVCSDAYTRAQALRDHGKLVEARDALRTCALPSCKNFIVKDCTAWLDAVETSLPTVVISVKDGAGADLFDVKVSIDGTPLLARLDGQAVPINPGAHTLYFELADRTRLDKRVLIKEGEHNRELEVVLKPSTAGDANGIGQRTSHGDSGPSVHSSSWKTVGWVAGGLGIAGLVVGTLFGVTAIGDKNSANCDAGNACDSGPLASAKRAALVADVGLIGGGALLASGLAFVVFAPSKDQTAGAIEVSPSLGANFAGLVVTGSR
jgi:hypothetical protein